MEFDHADIYDSIDEITKQFHYLMRTIPEDGQVLVRLGDDNLKHVIKRGVYSPILTFGGNDNGDWQWRFMNGDMATKNGVECCRFTPPITGAINRDNILAATAAAAAVGVDVAKIGEYLQSYQPPLRRLQKIVEANNILIFDDFAITPPPTGAP